MFVLDLTNYSLSLSNNKIRNYSVLLKDSFFFLKMLRQS